MAKIEDLIGEIDDLRLRTEVAKEIKRLKTQKNFGLVFEQHLPETVRLPNFPVHKGELVAERGAPVDNLWLVERVNKSKVICRRPEPKTDGSSIEFLLEKLVVVKRFGEAIYPALVPVARVARGGDKPWHVLVNADNFHALQLLLYAYERHVDMIYIDPPYNSGARDWKYNNDYVDKADRFRHSKWLSMMKKRLLLANFTDFTGTACACGRPYVVTAVCEESPDCEQAVQ
jgi:adenine-specific DNA-methyltransferase